jgi:trimeric autotransporter adhesin
VQYAGLSSAPVSVAVQATTPGLFSRDASGSGPGAILNQDYSYNEKARPAAVGSDVKLYCTGTGTTNPASVDGALARTTPPFPTIVAQPVSVKVGGIDATILYAGPAPGLIAGLTQIDILIPSGVPTASAVPVVVTIGGVSSQANLTLAVQ